MSNLYETVRECALSMGHKRFCAPLAMALVTGFDYMKCHDILVDRGYRHSGTSTTKKEWVEVLPELGFKLTKVRVSAKTNVTLQGTLNPDMKFLVAYRRHIAAYVGGKIEDWSEGKRNRIAFVTEVRPV